jgi:vesicle-fusing ATPase
MSRYCTLNLSKIGDSASVSTDYDNIKIIRDDFLGALDEVRPAYGVAEQELQQCILNGIIKFGHHIEVPFNGVTLANFI